jgi:hypothetical protein
MSSRLRLAVVMMTAVFVFLIAGTSLAQAAIPGDVLYPWKRASEQVYLVLSPHSLNVDIFLAERRSIEYLKVNDNPTQRDNSLQDYLEALTRLQTYEDMDERLLIHENLQIQRAALEDKGIQVQEIDRLLDQKSADSTPVQPGKNTETPPQETPPLGVTPTLRCSDTHAEELLKEEVREKATCTP